MTFLIREANEDDAPELVTLCCQLGYPITINDLQKNLCAILQNDLETIFVAVYKEKVIGWIGVFKSVHLTTGPLCEISGLVIDENFHGKGAGKQLIDEVKKWSKNHGENILRVRSNTIRQEAHSFYFHLGFKEVKDQKVFEIDL